MIIFLTILGIYLGGMAAFALWDAYIGFGVEFDGGTWPPVGIAYPFWPITLVCAVIAGTSTRLESVKERRIKKAEMQTRVRIAAEKEQEALLAQIEREMLEDEQSVQRGSRRD